MNQVPEEQKEALTKTFAIVGFVAVILLAVWLAVKIVSLMPSAFSSLASLADSVYNYPQTTEIKIDSPKSVINVGESTTISWNTFPGDGSYTFRFVCTEGLAIDLRLGGEVVPATCDTDIDLGNRTSLDLTVASEKKRFVDVNYTISYTGASGSFSTDDQITVVNATIPTSVVLEEPKTEEPTTSTPKPDVAGESTDTPIPTPTPTVTEEVIYAIPVSDPNGTTDLAITFLGVGILDANKQFIKTGVITLGQTGAFQFEVKNLGTKTSNEWTYSADLPADIAYNSSDQKALKPNERAVITLGFSGLTQTGVERFGVSLKTTPDVNTINNSFISAVSVR